MSDSDDKYQSRYELLEKPDFKPTIPPHMLAKLSESEKYIVSAISVSEQQYAWLVEHALATNRNLIEMDSWRQSMERWKTIITSKWAVLAIIGGMVAPAVLFALMEWLFGFLKH